MQKPAPIGMPSPRIAAGATFPNVVKIFPVTPNVLPNRFDYFLSRSFARDSSADVLTPLILFVTTPLLSEPSFNCSTGYPKAKCKK